jgi:hypothetical protein
MGRAGATGADEIIVNQLSMNAAYLSAIFGLGSSPDEPKLQGNPLSPGFGSPLNFG